MPRNAVLDLVYLAIFIILLPWIAWRRWSGGRPVAAPWTRFTGDIPPLPAKDGRRRIWMHGVSVGEVQLLSSLATALRAPAEADVDVLEIVASSSTTTGIDLARRRFGGSAVFPCPLDFTWAVRRVFERVDPDLLVLGELELWPHLLARAAARGVPVVIANARLSPRSARGYARVRPLVERMLRTVTLISARSDADAKRFLDLGGRDVVVAGSMKFDGVRGDRNAADVVRLAHLAGFRSEDTVFLAGSTQSPEEHLAVEAFRAALPHHPSLRLVLVPRHVERAAEVAALLDRAGVRWQSRSRLDADGADPQARVLLVDTTGELGWWWGTAAVAFVGGSLDGKRGGQNMLEPAAYGAAVCFGPHTRNFADEVRVLQEADAATVVADGRQLASFLARCLDDPAWAAARGARSAATVTAHRGATAATASRIHRLLALGRGITAGCRHAGTPQ